MALPLHGWAAVTMHGCGFSHHLQALALQPAAPAHGAHTAAEGARHDSAVDHRHHLGASSSHATHIDGHHQVGKFKCSACSTCCTTAALPTTWRPFEAVPPVQFALPALSGAEAVFLTDGPERPPRSILT